MRTTSSVFALCGLLFVLGANQHANAANYFNWGAESNTTSNGAVNGYFGDTTLDCTVRHSGSCSMKMNVIGPDGGNQSKGADMNQLTLPILTVGGGSLYYRTWLRFSSGFNWGAPQIANVKTQRALTITRFMTGHMRSDGFYIAECEFVSGYGGGCLTTGGVPNNDYNIRIPYDVQGKADGLWHEYVIRIKSNTTTSTRDAEFQVWVDGVSVGQLTGWKLTNTSAGWIEAWSGWMVTPYFQMNGDSSVGGTVWADDFSTDDVYNSLIGAGGTTPTITSVSGTVQSGQTLNITGSNMIQEDRTNWDPLFINNPNASGFEGASLTADGYQTSGCPTYTSAVKLMGNQSINMHDQGQHIRLSDGSGLGSCNWQWKVQASQSGTTWTDVYLRTYSRWNNTSWPTIDTKYWWWYQAFFNLTSYADGSAPTELGIYAANSMPDWVQGKIPGGAIKNNKWYLFETHFRVDGNGGPYVYQVWIDNQQIINFTAPAGALVNVPGWGWGGESNTNYFNTPAGWVSDQWQDGFAVSKTRIGPASLVEISNCSAYGSGTKRYQEPLYLSDGSSQIKLDVTGLGAGPYVLWVTNNRNERSLPFLLGNGTPSCAPGGGAVAPSSPTNLRVQ